MRPLKRFEKQFWNFRMVWLGLRKNPRPPLKNCKTDEFIKNRDKTRQDSLNKKFFKRLYLFRKKAALYGTLKDLKSIKDEYYNRVLQDRWILKKPEGRNLKRTTRKKIENKKGGFMNALNPNNEDISLWIVELDEFLEKKIIL